MNDFKEFIFIRDRLSLIVLVLAMIFGGLLSTFFFLQSVWMILLLALNGFCMWYFLATIRKVTVSWNKRNIIKNIILEGSSSTVKFLLQLEMDGYPVFEVVRSHTSFQFKDRYEEYVLSRYFEFSRKANSLHVVADERNKASERITLIKLLPSFRQMDPDRTKADIWSIKQTAPTTLTDRESFPFV